MNSTTSNELITAIDQVTTEWLTAVLARSGALTRGEVAAFDVIDGRGNWSTNARLEVTYSADAQGARPARLFLKMVDADDEEEPFDDSEVTYYTRDYVDVPDAPLLRCYDAAWSPALKRYHLLLEDVSATHVEAVEKGPSLEHGLALAEALATLHARWWGGARLAEAGAPIHDAAHIRRFVAIAQPGVGHIVAEFAGQLQPHWPALMAELFAHHPQAMLRRTQDLSGFTLIHGDAGHGNILVPRAGHRPLYLIDRQPFNWSLTTWLGAYDLAYALALGWPVELRRQCELAILERYHATLIGKGVGDYPWQQLWDDYRLCVAMGVYVAVEYCRGGINQRLAFVWLPMLQRALTACNDLDCRALWQG